MYTYSLQNREEAAGGPRLTHEQDLAWLQQADVIMTEVTQPSWEEGSEMDPALTLSRDPCVLFCLRSGQVPLSIIGGAADGSQVQVWDYEMGDMEATLVNTFWDQCFWAGGHHPWPLDLTQLY